MHTHSDGVIKVQNQAIGMFLNITILKLLPRDKKIGGVESIKNVVNGMIPFGELSRFKAPISRPSAQKQDIVVFLEKKCAISRFVLMLDKLINLEKLKV